MNNFIYTLTFILSVLLWYLAKSSHKAKEDMRALEQTISELNQQVELDRIMVDSVYVYRGQTQDLKMTLKNVQDRYSSLLDATKIKPKYVDRITTVSTITHNTDTIVCYTDTFGGVKAVFDDGYAHINIDVTPQRKAVVDYSIKDSISIINYQKKHSLLFGLIKWNSYERTEVVTYNPNSTTCTLTSVKTIR